MKLNLKARLVAAIAQFKAGNDIRYYLNGVYVEPHPDSGAILVATNGHAMGIWHDASGEVERPVILNVTKALLAACAGGNEIDKRRLVDKTGRLTVMEEKTGAEIYIQAERGTKVGAEQYEVEGKFPDWRKVVPDIEPGRTQLYNVFQPQYLSLASEALRIACGTGKWGNELTLRQPALDKGIVVQSSQLSADGFVGIIMPARDDMALSLPAWVKAPKQPDPLPSQPSDAAPAYDAVADGVAMKLEVGEGITDPLYAEAVAIVRKHNKASISLVQRHLKIGYNRTARMIDDMEKAGIVSHMDGSGQRVVKPAMAAAQEGGAV